MKRRKFIMGYDNLDFGSMDGFHFHELTPMATKRVIELTLGDRKRARKASRILRKLAIANKLYK